MLLRKTTSGTLRTVLKEKIAGVALSKIDVLHLGVHDAASHFNIGANAFIKTPEKTGIECSLADKQRTRSANRKSEESKKKRRKIIRARRKAKGDQDSLLRKLRRKF